MKTAPEKALKMLSEVQLNPIHEILRYKADIIARIAFKEGQSSPNIKQLEWEESDGEYWEAITPIGTYSITFDFGVYVALYDMDNAVDGEWRSLAKARIACNNDFEKRVMECLDL